MSQSLFQESTQVLKEAIQKRIFNPLPTVFLRLANGTPNLLGPLMDQVQAQREKTLVPSPWLHQQASWQLPTTRRYQQSTAPPVQPIVQPIAASPWMVEVARFPVSGGSVGIIKSFEQFLSSPGLVTPTIHSIAAANGNPFPVAGISWYFRLSDIERLAQPWINVQGVSAIPEYLPGIPYSDLSSTDDLWFPACSSASTNFHLPIPGGQILRLFFLCGAQDEESPLTVSAKLAGTTQVETNPDAQYVVRTTW